MILGKIGRSVGTTGKSHEITGLIRIIETAEHRHPLDLRHRRLDSQIPLVRDSRHIVRTHIVIKIAHTLRIMTVRQDHLPCKASHETDLMDLLHSLVPCKRRLAQHILLYQIIMGRRSACLVGSCHRQGRRTICECVELVDTKGECTLEFQALGQSKFHPRHKIEIQHILIIGHPF